MWYPTIRGSDYYFVDIVYFYCVLKFCVNYGCSWIRWHSSVCRWQYTSFKRRQSNREKRNYSQIIPTTGRIKKTQTGSTEDDLVIEFVGLCGQISNSSAKQREIHILVNEYWRRPVLALLKLAMQAYSRINAEITQVK